MIISNHDKLCDVATMFGIPFHHIPILKGEGGKRAQEQKIEALVEEHEIDLLVMAK